MRESLRRWFRRYQDRISPTRYQIRQFIRSRLAATPVGSCVDLGAGISPYRTEIQHNGRAEIYISTDLFPTDQTTLVCDAIRLPLADGSVDLVCAFDMMTCLPDPVGILKEARRVLAPGGRLLVTYAFLIAESGVHDYRRWTIRGMEHDLRLAGFEVIDHAKRGGFIYSLAMLGAIAMSDLIPGNRDSWRAGSSIGAFVRMGVTSLLILPFQLIGWVGMHIDRFFPNTPFYFGGMAIARRSNP